MLSIRRPFHITSPPLGQRPGVPYLASGAPDLGWETKRAESEASARSRAYPSPPMSGSPPLPPKAAREANERGEGPALYSSALPQDVYRERPTQQPPADHRQHLPPPVPVSRLYPQEPSRGPYSFQRPREEPMPQTPLYSPQQPHGVPHGVYQQEYTASAGPSSEGSYSVTSRASGLENQSYTSPKSQRKTKGHVASACVPCKRAHLRGSNYRGKNHLGQLFIFAVQKLTNAAAQRPCSRCLSNGKEDACVDVQHKKRGRPRLRDDRDARYDPLRLPQYPDISLRRPLGVYGPGDSGDQGFDDPLQRHQLYRPLEAPMSGTLPHRQFDRASDVRAYGTTSLAAACPEAAAYRTMGMEFSKASPTFLDAIGAVSVTGRRLGDVVVNTEAERIFNIQNQLAGEQKRREPNYLPPILGHGGPVIQGLGFNTSDVARFPLNIQEQLTFIGPDGYPRQHLVRVGLGKEGSVYFVVMLLSLQHRYPHPPSSQARNPPTHLYHTSPSPQPPFAPRTPVPAHFDPVRHRLSEGSLNFRAHLGLHNQANQAPPPTNPGTTPAATHYDPSTSRNRYPGPPPRSSHETGRNDSSLPVSRTVPPRFQLPPIRAQSEHRPPLGTQGWQRDERWSRVDIGGLIEKPEGPWRSQ
ncbi:hypothetical protein TOPH_02196 [Tolypocladium ophioglossoides CBS 100239]|uniref:Uncharacterized protein n=1 Tax=Tolypocladium ophioglossoides (strain CBS 100239) TaxID=1163406 RepID=A0A0L0NGG8_TOLOC|nr:hypothetical protein TOPH_02196 [Tolypocladium ophioglossoides CBS 100239]